MHQDRLNLATDGSRFFHASEERSHFPELVEVQFDNFHLLCDTESTVSIKEDAYHGLKNKSKYEIVPQRRRKQIKAVNAVRRRCKTYLR